MLDNCSSIIVINLGVEMSNLDTLILHLFYVRSTHIVCVLFQPRDFGNQKVRPEYQFYCSNQLLLNFITMEFLIIELYLSRLSLY